MTPAGFPHSEIHGSMPACGYPWLIAAYHVLHRLLMPRHPPYALFSLIVDVTSLSIPKTKLSLEIVYTLAHVLPFLFKALLLLLYMRFSMFSYGLNQPYFSFRQLNPHGSALAASLQRPLIGVSPRGSANRRAPI